MKSLYNMHQAICEIEITRDRISGGDRRS